MTTGPTPMIEIVDLQKAYSSELLKTPVLRGIEMHIEPGEIALILGPSGSGKTTLMNIIGGVDRGQRVSLARAIVKNPKVLLCDEPTGALDYETARTILALIQRVNRKYGTTIVMVTHNTAIAAMATSVFKLRSGVIEEASIGRTPAPAEGIAW